MILHFLLANALATSFYVPPFSDFTREASLIARGITTNIHTENSINDAGTKVIYTYAAFDVKDLIKGSLAKSTIQIRKLGGTKDGDSLEIPGSPEFKEGEEGVLFLGPEKEDQSYEVQSLELGQYGVRERHGQIELTGGIFNYAKPSDHNAGQAQAENQKIWTVASLKKLVEEQKTNPAQSGATKVAGTPPAVKALDSQTDSTHPKLSPEPKSTAQNENPGTLLFFSLAVVLSLGLIFFFRKG